MLTREFFALMFKESQVTHSSSIRPEFETSCEICLLIFSTGIVMEDIEEKFMAEV